MTVDNFLPLHHSYDHLLLKSHMASVRPSVRLNASTSIVESISDRCLATHSPYVNNKTIKR
jgi:hypothetical protein